MIAVAMPVQHFGEDRRPVIGLLERFYQQSTGKTERDLHGDLRRFAPIDLPGQHEHIEHEQRPGAHDAGPMIEGAVHSAGWVRDDPENHF